MGWKGIAIGEVLSTVMRLPARLAEEGVTGWLAAHLSSRATESEPQDHDLRFAQAVNYIAFGSWNRPYGENIQKSTTQRTEAVQVIQQVAIDGDLPICGRKHMRFGRFLRIPPDYWEEYEVECVGWMNDREEWNSVRVGVSYNEDVRYDLRTSRAAIIKLRERLARREQIRLQVENF
jgi:hypothetical protein